jgi:hypothetical protein
MSDKFIRSHRTASETSRQVAKIADIGKALRAEGHHHIEEQARALGLLRSTAWTVVKANQARTGLTAGLIRKMLTSASLSLSIRKILIEYIEERLGGRYGERTPRSQRAFEALQTEFELRQRGSAKMQNANAAALNSDQWSF